MTTRPSTAAPILAMLAIVLVMLGAYAGAYFWLGEEYEVRWSVGDIGDDGFHVHPNALTGITRVFTQQWHVVLFQPASKIEAWSRRIEVETMDMRSWLLTRESG